MIVTPQEMDLILERQNGRQLRRIMRLPVIYNAEADRRRCPMQQGRSYLLSNGLSKCTTTRITITEQPYRERLDDLSPSDARREGYKTVIEAINGFVARWGYEYPGREVWVVAFIVTGDDVIPIGDTPVFLAKDGGYTTIAGRQAVPGDPEACIHDVDEGERARVLALARRGDELRTRVGKSAAQLEVWAQHATTTKARQLLLKAARAARAAEADIPSADGVDSRVSAAVDGAAS